MHDEMRLVYHVFMQRRSSSRLLVLNDQQQVLLFRFDHKNGPLSGQSFWATPGGGVEEGESYEDAACRELHEEVGLKINDPGIQVAQRSAVFTLPDGMTVEADERYFIITVDELTISGAGQTELEREIMTAHRWWSQAELRNTTEQVWPEDLSEMLIHAGFWIEAA